MNAPAETYFPVGIVTRPHGIHGDVKIRSMMSDPQLLSTATKVRATYADGKIAHLEISDIRVHGQFLLVHFSSVDDRQSAEQLRDTQLDIARSDLPPLGEDEYYLGDLVGYQVVTEAGEEIGQITQALDLPANDVIEVCCDDRPVLIPLVDEIIRGIDHAARRVTVRPIEGLLE